MSDALLPVFSFRANWREPLSERLAFLTDILGTPQGVEQRRALRPTPRRTYEADFLLTSSERTFWDLFIDRLGGNEVVAPLYWEVVSIPASLVAGDTDRINFDTRLREWQYHTGYLAILMGKTALDYEVVEIASVDDNGVMLADPVTRPWPKGTKLLPLRRAVLDQVGGLRHLSAGVATVTAQLRVIGSNPWVPAADASPVYGGLPVFLEEPNWVEDLEVSMDREIALLDTSLGITYQVDATGRALVGQAHRWFLTGRQRLASFRDLVYRHEGRQGAFWLPTFKADLKMVSPVLASATQITVENVGYQYTGGPTSGRRHIAIKHSGGTILRRIVSVIPGSTSATERLNLDAPVGLDLSPGQVRRISFADTARFDTDEFEIVHHGGVDAHHSTSAMFRTFRNTRTNPLPIHAPIPPAAKNSTPCGVTLDSGVLNISANDFTPANRDTGGLVLSTSDPTATLIITKPPASTTGGVLLYDAYSLWPSDSEALGRTWQNQFWVRGGNSPDAIDNLIFDAGTLTDGGFFYFQTQQDAFDGLAAFMPLTFTGFRYYRISCIVDINLGDNRGGISLLASIVES